MPRPIEGIEKKQGFSLAFEPALMEKFKEIAKRENKSVSELLADLINTYVKAHGEGNSFYTLDNLVKAYPTAWENWEIEKLDEVGYTLDELNEMKAFLSYNISILSMKIGRMEKPKTRHGFGDLSPAQIDDMIKRHNLS